MNIVIEEIVLNPLIQIEETIEEITIAISEMQVPGATGADGKSAYQSALDGGFIGTELEFNTFLSEVDKLDNLSGINTGDETASTIINKIGDGTKINQSYLPSYVDDILEFDTVELFPLFGELGKIYIVTTGADINKQYRWTGSLYTQITNGLIASTNDVPEGINNLYFTVARFLSNLTAGNIKSALGITTLSGSNTGDQDLSNVVKNIAKESSQGANITGTVSETILYSKLIPANTFKDGDFMNLFSRIARPSPTASSGGVNQRVRINTSNTLTGATQIALNNATAGVSGNQFVSMQRTFNVTNGFLVGIISSQFIQSDIINSNSPQQFNVFNPTVDNYIFVTGQLGFSGDTMYHLGTKITN